MTLRRDEDLYSIECDNCGYASETDAEDFDDAISLFRQDGWRYRRKDTGRRTCGPHDIFHFCQERCGDEHRIREFLG